MSCTAKTADSADIAAALWQKFTGVADRGKTASPIEVWAMDIPKWELDAVIAKLREEHFFRRSKIFGATVFVGTEINGVRFGKNYREVSELDALILRVRSQGRMLQGAAPADGLDPRSGSAAASAQGASGPSPLPNRQPMPPYGSR